jgi:hypothetical protein
MGGFNLVSRVAFICNICFVLALILQKTKLAEQGEIVSLIIIMGYGMAVIGNAIGSLWYLLLRWNGKKSNPATPLWLVIVNFLFLIIQLILFLR